MRSFPVVVLLLLVLAAAGAAWMERRAPVAGPAAATRADTPTGALPPRPRLVLLYAPCTVTIGHLGPYDPTVAYTPALSAFAEEAVVFEQHQTEAGRSAIDYAALFTGSQAMHHAVFANQDALPEDAYTIAEAFRDAGYETYFWVGHPFASAQLNFAQGIAPERLFDGNVGMGVRHYAERGFLRADDPTFEEILARVRTDPDYRALIMTNFSVTHGPYLPHHQEEFCRLYPSECGDLTAAEIAHYGALWTSRVGALALFPAASTVGISDDEFSRLTLVVELLYKSTVYHLDGLFGAVVDALRSEQVLDQTAIIFTTDHGEIMYRPNARMAWAHGFQLAPEVLRIPLLLRAPGVPAGRYGAVSRSVDVLPTVAALAQVPLPAAPERMGVNLLPALLGRSEPPVLAAFSHTTLTARNSKTPPDPETMLVAMRAGDRVYKEERGADGAIRRAVYDWASDPTETDDLYTADDDPMFERLAAYKATLVGAFRGEVEEERRPVLNDAELERLRQLGYADE